MKPALLVLVCLLGLGCNTHVFSPPAGNFPIESAATVGAGRRSVGLDVAFAEAIFGPSFSSYRVSYRHGLSEQFEVSAAPSLIWVHGSGSGDSHPGIYALRGAIKYAPIPHVAGSFGLGAGASAAGGFLSPDVGITGSYENRYVVPFGSMRGLLSAPIMRRQVHFTTGDDAGEDANDADDVRDTYRRIPRFSFGLQASTGIRLPIWRYGSDPAPEPRVRPALNCALGITFLIDLSGNRETPIGFGCGFDLGF